MKTYLYYMLLFGCFHVLISGKARGQDIGVSGEWTLVIDESAIVDDEIIDTHESETGQILLNVSHASYGWFGNWSWRVSVHKVDLNWHGNLNIDVRRTGNGFGFGSISGGTGYQEIDSISRTFFSGTRHRIWIGCQYRIRGVGPQIPPGTYTTSIVYTVVQL